MAFYLAKYNPAADHQKQSRSLRLEIDEGDMPSVLSSLGLDPSEPRVLITVAPMEDQEWWVRVAAPQENSPGVRLYTKRVRGLLRYCCEVSEGRTPRMARMPSFGLTACEAVVASGRIDVRVPAVNARRAVRSLAREPAKGVTTPPTTTEVLVDDVLCDVPFAEALALVARHARR